MRPTASLQVIFLLLVLAPPLRAEIGQDVLEPDWIGARTFAESYTLIADLEPDVYLQLQAVVSNYGLSSGKGGCRLLLVEGEQRTLSEGLDVSRRDWGYSDEGTPTLQIGTCRIVGGERTEFHVRVEGAEIVLRLDAPVTATRPRDARLEVGSRFYESEILIPWAPAEATITRDGESTRVLRGFGYGDHSRATTLPRDLATRWVRFRGLARDGSVLILARFPGEGASVDGWAWSQGDARPEPLSSVDLARVKDETWTFKVRTVSGDVYVIETEREIHRFAPMEQGGFFARLLRRIVGNPVTYTYRAVSIRDGEGDARLRGIAEVTIVDES